MEKSAHFRIGDRRVGPGEPCFIIAEVAQAHDGSLGAAHAYIDMAAQCGADAVKFQTHFAAEESTPAEPWRIQFSRQDGTRYEYWRRMEFDEAQWTGLAEHAAEAGIVFLSSAFSAKAVDLLTRLGMPAWKIASGEVSNHALLAQMVSTKKPILLSSGMSSWAELDAAVNLRPNRRWWAGDFPDDHVLSVPPRTSRAQRHERAPVAIRLPRRLVGPFGRFGHRHCGSSSRSQYARGSHRLLRALLRP